jgi:hypothetical protein
MAYRLASYANTSSVRQIAPLCVTDELVDQFRQRGFDYAAIHIARTQQAGTDKKKLKINNADLDPKRRSTDRDPATIPALADGGWGWSFEARCDPEEPVVAVFVWDRARRDGEMGETCISQREHSLLA